MTQAEGRALRDGIRECSVCPDYIVRCAHIGDERLFLTDRDRSTPRWIFDKLPRFLGGKEHDRTESPIAVSYFFEGDDEQDAEAAFYEAEERLLAHSLPGDGE